jgi:hypothetical protein
MVITWDATYETLPSNTLRIGLIDNIIRDLSFGIRERMSVEHEWGPGSDLNDGSHIPGGTSVLDTGDATTLAAVTGMQQGALYLKNTGTDLNLMIYKSGAWQALSTMDHDLLTGRTDDDHPQYVLKDGGVMTGSLDMANFFIVAPTTVDGVYSGLVAARHMALEHPSLGSLDAIKANTISKTAFKTVKQVDTYTMTYAPPNDMAIWEPHPLEFFPAIYIQNAAANIILATHAVPGGRPGLALFYQSHDSGSCIVKVFREWIDV